MQWLNAHHMHGPITRHGLVVLANQFAIGLAAVDRPVLAAGRGGLVCAHCGFASGHERAFFCPKCGMRLLRS
jgi:rubrerythrin